MSGYDHVGIRISGGGYNLISRGEFEKKHLDERVRLTLGGAQFIRDGRVIPAVEALRKQSDDPSRHE